MRRSSRRKQRGKPWRSIHLLLHLLLLLLLPPLLHTTQTLLQESAEVSTRCSFFSLHLFDLMRCRLLLFFLFCFVVFLTHDAAAAPDLLSSSCGLWSHFWRRGALLVIRLLASPTAPSSLVRVSRRTSHLSSAAPPQHHHPPTLPISSSSSSSSHMMGATRD